jgi:LysR family carnitine catabolism transcriptional activator
MTPHNLSTRDLRGFLALAEAKHFRRAAERCRLSQAAFSQLIRRVETAAGMRLFERSTRQVSLTAEGEVLVAAAARIVADTDAALADLQDHAARRKGRVGVAALPSLAAGSLPAIFALYRARHPGVQLELFDALSDRCVALVREGRADFALTAAGPSLTEFDTRPLTTDDFYLVCRRDHPLASRRKVRLSDLADCPIIHLARSTSVRQHLEPVLRDVPHALSGLEVEQLPTAAALISSGLGVSLVPALTLSYFRVPELAAVPVDQPGLSRRILVVQRKGRKLSAAAQAMLELVERQIGRGAKLRRESARR